MATEDIAAWFSGLSFVASVAAVIISSKAQTASDLAASGAIRSADSAERSNDINLHNSRLEIYKAFQGLQGKLVQRGPKLQEGDVWPFLDQAHLSEFYFDVSLYKRLTNIVDRALDLVSRAEALDSAVESPSLYPRPMMMNMRAELYEKHKELRKECGQIDELLRAELRLFKHGRLET